MKINIRNIIPWGVITALLLSMGACQDMLETDSNRVAFEEDNALNNPDAPFYVISGILRELQKIGDNYVIMGELRGDLMNTSDLASVSLKEINDFQVSKDNEYLDQRNYYNVINHCNYAIQKMDTSIFIANEKVMIPAYAMIKSIRAWTYMQLGLIYGSAIYVEEPILSLESSLTQYPTVSMDNLFDLLEDDLLPYINVREPAYNIAPARFVPVKAILGDIYLYQGRYEDAALMYYRLMDPLEGNYTLINDSYAYRWTNSNANGVWYTSTHGYFGEAIAGIQYSDDPKDFHSALVGLTYNGRASLLPTSSFVDFMTMAVHFHQNSPTVSTVSIMEGDLRGTVYSKFFNLPVAYEYITFKNTVERVPLISKFHRYETMSASGTDPNNNLIEGGLSYLTWVALLRNVHVYLRYAEAVNRAGKPSLAFAVLKYGLKNATLSNSLMVNQAELANGEMYVNFEHTTFDGNVGTASRGRGLGVSAINNAYQIPDFTESPTAKQDSINWVEDRILEEMAAETAFEGNRFFDLLRVSKRRDNHPAFMAEKVARKYGNPDVMKTRLASDINAWFVKP